MYKQLGASFSLNIHGQKGPWILVQAPHGFFVVKDPALGPSENHKSKIETTQKQGRQSTTLEQKPFEQVFFPLEGNLEDVIAALPFDARPLITEALDGKKLPRGILKIKPRANLQKANDIQEEPSKLPVPRPLLPTQGAVSTEALQTVVQSLRQVQVLSEAGAEVLSNIDTTFERASKRLLFRDLATGTLLDVRVATKPDGTFEVLSVFVPDKNAKGGWALRWPNNPNGEESGRYSRETRNMLLWFAGENKALTPTQVDALWWVREANGSRPEGRKLGYERRQAAIEFAKQNPKWGPIVETMLALDNGVATKEIQYRLGYPPILKKNWPPIAYFARQLRARMFRQKNVKEWTANALATMLANRSDTERWPDLSINGKAK